jgi:TP53 regulating kinase-like protein
MEKTEGISNKSINSRGNIIGIGAEAILIKENNLLKKVRIRKNYRHEKIDETLRKLRTRKEAKILTKLSEFKISPKIYKVDEFSKEIIMDYLEGERLSETLDSYSIKKQKEIAKEIGKNISILHSLNIIHGDLTTSNMILSNDFKNNSRKEKEIVYFIDFGLSFESRKVEDMAVDLRLLKQAICAKHFKTGELLFKTILDEYLLNSKNKNSKKVILQIKNVENRGRYKQKQLRIKKNNKKNNKK